MSIINVFAYGITLIVIYYGGNAVINGEITKGEMSSFIIYVTTLTFSLLSMSNSMNELINAKGILENLLSYISPSNRICEKAESALEILPYNSDSIISQIHTEIVSFEDLTSHKRFNKPYLKSIIECKLTEESKIVKNKFKFDYIQFKDVSFGYDSSIKVINNLNISIKRGNKIGIVGSSGAGKSSFISLLMRFYQIEEGNILINGNKNIYEIPFEEYRLNIAYVPQDPFLFSGSIKDNILYGIKSYSNDDLNQAINESNVNQFVNDINTFPNGINTIIGEKGIRLSGGQKQRIAIARALMRKPSIYILDEATSSLDSISESYVQESINNIAINGENTVIIIAHRLSTVIKCNELFVFKNGQIVEKGNHSTLIAKEKSEYKKLFEKQSY